MNAVTLRTQVRADMIAHARDEAPNECCGLLIGRQGHIEEARRARNLASDPSRYFLDPADHIAANRRLRGTRRRVIGVYHSHPGSPAVPSETDLAEALYPEFVWIIVSLIDPAGDVAAFTFTDEGVTSVDIILES